MSHPESYSLPANTGRLHVMDLSYHRWLDIAVMLFFLPLIIGRNRRASDDLQAYQRDRQTSKASSSSESIWLFSCYPSLVQELMCQVVKPTFFHGISALTMLLPANIAATMIVPEVKD